MKRMRLLLTALCALSLSASVFASEPVSEKVTAAKAKAEKTKKAKASKKATTPKATKVAKAKIVVSDEQHWSNTADKLIAQEAKRQKESGSLELSASNSVLRSVISHLETVLREREKAAQKLDANLEVNPMEM